MGSWGSRDGLLDIRTFVGYDDDDDDDVSRDG